MIWIIWTLSAVFNIMFLKEVNDDEFGLWCVLVAIVGPVFSILILAQVCATIIKKSEEDEINSYNSNNTISNTNGNAF